MFADVMLPLPFDRAFTYLIPENIKLARGRIVTVPFRNRAVNGVYLGQAQNAAPDKEYKAISAVMEYALPESALKFAEFVADYNLIPRGMVYKMIMPPSDIAVKNRQSKDVHIERASQVVELSAEQNVALNDLIAEAQKGFNVSVLEGVTGSGKTEVYLEQIAHLCEQGGQALILLPEILLTTQLKKRFQARMNIPVVEWHSNLGKAERRGVWKRVISGEKLIITGVRSALFLPFQNLKLIIVDEEHEPSYKQEENGCYHARDMAIVRAKCENAPIVLASATPSIETELNVREKKYHHVFLKARYGASKLPQIEVIDLIKNKPPRGKWITAPLMHAIKQDLARQKQVLLFVNRRGYSSVTICSECKHKVSCPHCDFNMVEHKAINKLICHYCGHEEKLSNTCKACGAEAPFNAFGLGVERIAEELAELLPEARVAVVSSDTVDSRKKTEELIRQIENHEVDIIVGTQMVTKGLHFPKIDLVGIIDADMGLYTGDIRALERTYQIIKQVSGRAGRESEDGRVFLQTIEPESYLIESIKHNDWPLFIENELANREEAFMPPYSRIAMVHLSGRDQISLRRYMRALGDKLVEDENIRVLGPSVAPIFMIKQNYRFRFIFIAAKNINIQKYIKNWLQSVSHDKLIEVRIDVDPITFS